MITWDTPPFLLTRIKVYPIWISNPVSNKGWDEIIYLFPNFSSATVDVWEWISYFILHFTGHVVTSMLVLKLICFSERNGSHLRSGARAAAAMISDMISFLEHSHQYTINLSWAVAGISQKNYFLTMSSAALAPQGAKSSPALLLHMYD